jgi:hypothetical protein
MVYNRLVLRAGQRRPVAAPTTALPAERRVHAAGTVMMTSSAAAIIGAPIAEVLGELPMSAARLGDGGMLAEGSVVRFL